MSATTPGVQQAVQLEDREMSTTTPGIQQAAQLKDRDIRALSEYITVFAEAPGMFTVYAEGSTYTVDLETEACECPDSTHRDPEGGCKHIRRVRFTTGARTIPACLNPTGDWTLYD
jgi:hypothetical protein